MLTALLNTLRPRRVLARIRWRLSSLIACLLPAQVNIAGVTVQGEDKPTAAPKAVLSLAAKNLIQLDSFSASDPLVALFERDEKGQYTRLIAQTEWAQ